MRPHYKIIAQMSQLRAWKFVTVYREASLKESTEQLVPKRKHRKIANLGTSVDVADNLIPAVPGSKPTDSLVLQLVC